MRALLAVALSMIVGSLSSSAVAAGQTGVVISPESVQLATASAPFAAGLATTVSTCTSGQGAVYYRSLRLGTAGSPVLISRCPTGKLAFYSQPSVVINYSTHQVAVVWSQMSVGSREPTKIDGIYFARSANLGRTFTRPKRLVGLEGHSGLPPVVTAAAYAHRIFVLWADEQQIGARTTFHLQGFDDRTGYALPQLHFGNYHVMADQANMQVVASSDGVAAFWLDTNGRTGKETWYAADTQPINPNDPYHHVKFVYRGQIGDQTIRVFEGLDGHPYRLLAVKNSSDPVDPIWQYELYRWRFLSHAFVPANGSTGTVLSLPVPIVQHDPDIAAGVGVDGTFYLARTSITGSNSDCISTGLIPCLISTESGGLNSPLLSVDVVSATGNHTTLSLPLPYQQPQFVGANAEFAQLSPLSFITSAFGGVGVFYYGRIGLVDSAGLVDLKNQRVFYAFERAS